MISKRREAARRWRTWLITRQPMAELKRTVDRGFFFGEEGPEQFASGGLLDCQGHELATLPKGVHVFPNRIES